MAAGSNKVGCAGIIVADTICGPIAQLPAEGQLTIVDEMPTKIGGCAANVAVDLAKQGVDAELVGCVGQILRNQLRQLAMRAEREAIF